MIAELTLANIFDTGITAIALLFVVLAAYPERADARQDGVPSTDSGSVLSVTTHLVQLSLVVHDEQGNPVRHLTKSDFHVTDNGNDQRVSLLEENKIDKSDIRLEQDRSASLFQFANRPRSQVNRNVPTRPVLLVDLFNTKLSNQADAKAQVVEFLRRSSATANPSEIYLLNSRGSLAIVQKIGEVFGQVDSSKLSRALSGVGLSLDYQYPIEQTQERGARNESRSQVSAFEWESRVRNTCDVFKQLARHLAGIPGRKSLIWVSEGFPFGIDASGTGRRKDISSSFEMLALVDGAVEAFNEADVSVYPVESGGLTVPNIADASKSLRFSTIGTPSQNTQEPRIEALKYIADGTGGKAVYNSNDISSGIHQVIDDASSSYTIGYDLPEGQWDDKFHRVHVNVIRPKVVVRTKDGYVARRLLRPSPDKLAKLIVDAIQGPLDLTDISIVGWIEPASFKAGSSRSRVGIVVDPSSLTFSHLGDRLLASMDVLVAEIFKDHRVVELKKPTI